ncbi:hypothetical protein GC175_02505 [bacterium]|nr:hypothetical protein [bacterium]
MITRLFSPLPGAAFFRSASFVRVALLLLILLSFARVVWRLNANNLWWDESLSLQRAESDWWTLLRGKIVMFDGLESVASIDQHPFGFFVLLGILVRFIGEDEFVLRFPAVMGTVLLVPVIWAMARYGARCSILPPATPLIVATLAAFSPFFLYYGQEARMYTLLPLLSILPLYLLLRWFNTEPGAVRRRLLIGYGGTTVFFLVTHYFAVLVLPIHALLFLQFLYKRSRRLAWGIAAGLLGLCLLIGLTASWLILRQPLSGRNFNPISLQILVPDLLNAFSLGLSVNIEQVWWLNVIFALTAFVGAVWTVGRWSRLKVGGWIWLFGLLVPVLLLLIINLFQPAYMNARHLAIISGFYLLLLAAGIALVWQWLRFVGVGLMVLFLSGMVYSSFNYYTMPIYGKDDFASLGVYLQRELSPGDLVLLSPPEMLRLYRYYLPVDRIEEARQQGIQIDWHGVPTLNILDTPERMSALIPGYRRVWVVSSGMVPFVDPLRTVRSWMDTNAFQIRDVNFFSSQSFLELDLYLPAFPEVPALPPDVTPVNASFDHKINLVGYHVAQPLTPNSVIPVTLYWQAMRPLDAQYKYLLYLEMTGADRQTTRLPVTEREPYDGFSPTAQWLPDQLRVEYSDVLLPPHIYETVADGTLRLVLQIYDAATLDTLPILSTTHGEIAAEGHRLLFDFPVPPPNLP